MSDPTLNRRQLLQSGGVAAGALLLPRFKLDAVGQTLMSFIGEYASDGAFVASVVNADVPIDLAVSTFPDLRDYTLVGAQVPGTDFMVRHDLAGLTPGTQYYARLVASGTLFGPQVVC